MSTFLKKAFKKVIKVEKFLGASNHFKSESINNNYS